MNPRPTIEELRRFYESAVTEDSVLDVARSSANRVLDQDKLAYFRSNRIAPLVERLPQGARIFDVGCGVGAFIYAMSQEGYEVCGNDLSKVSVDVGRDLLGLDGSAIQVGDISEIPVGQQFDLVTLWTVIEHLLSPETFLNHLRQNCLAQTGYIVLEFPTVDSLMFEFCHEHFFWVMPPYHINLFSTQGISSLLKRAQFEVVYEHCMPNNWFFFESYARKIGVETAELAKIKAQNPALAPAFDRLLDELSLRLGKSSTRWVLARRIDQEPRV
jgi:SAM-dependent methyltransferase